MRKYKQAWMYISLIAGVGLVVMLVKLVIAELPALQAWLGLSTLLTGKVVNDKLQSARVKTQTSAYYTSKEQELYEARKDTHSLGAAGAAARLAELQGIQPKG